MTSLPNIVITKTDMIETHLNEKQLVMPLYWMGACGDNECVRLVVKIPVNKDGLSRDFWGRVAYVIAKNPYLDWHWHGMLKNVIQPNLEHIRIACQIKSDKILERFEEDGYVFINNWYNTNDSEDDSEDIIHPDGASCFDIENVEY